MKKLRGESNGRSERMHVLVSEFLITASPDYMNGLSDEEQRRYFETAVDHLKEKYSAENMLYATVHMDEATPHMHVGIVPITEDGRLSAKDFFNGKLKMKAIQDDFHRHMVENGFDLVRGEPSEKKHENVHQYKINQREPELERLNAEIALKEKQREELEKQNKAVQAVIEVKKESLTAKAEELKMPTIEHEKAWLKKDKVIVPERELHALYAYAEQKTKTAAELAGQLKSETQEKERWQSIARQKQIGRMKKTNGFRNCRVGSIQKLKRPKRKCGASLQRNLRKNKRQDLRQEVKEELTTLRTENEELSAENKVLIIQRNSEAAESLKLKQELDKRNGQYAEVLSFAKKQNQTLEKVAGENKALKKENKTLKERVAVLEQWKDKMVQWAKEKLPKMRKLAASFFVRLECLEKPINTRTMN
uniref:Gamma-glutamyltranspeptidase n=1 Tax=Bacillus subtilis TaxID=1423 RepID=Q53260_BACIU|nr:gamma-glutamyltranspeptidase [Bacillus subtilis]